MMTTRRQAEILRTVIFSSIIIILSSSFLFALPDDAGTSIIFKYPSTEVVNYTTVNVNNSQFLQGYTPQQVANLYMELDSKAYNGTLAYNSSLSNYAQYQFNNNNFNGSGTISTSKLAINDSSPNAIFSMGSDAYAQKMLLYNSGNSRYGFGIQTKEMRLFSASSARITLGYIGSDGSTYTEKFRFDNQLGYLGIGTTLPNTTLSVNGKLTIMPSVILTCNSTIEGAVYYNITTHKHYGCNSTTWNALY